MSLTPAHETNDRIPSDNGAPEEEHTTYIDNI